MNIKEVREGAAFQVQSSYDGKRWVPRWPSPDGLAGTVPGGDHWYNTHHDAWDAAKRLFDATTRYQVRVVVRDRRGNVAGTVPVV